MVRPSPLPLESEWKVRRPMIRLLALKPLGIGRTAISPLYGLIFTVLPRHPISKAPPQGAHTKEHLKPNQLPATGTHKAGIPRPYPLGMTRPMLVMIPVQPTQPSPFTHPRHTQVLQSSKTHQVLQVRQPKPNHSQGFTTHTSYTMRSGVIISMVIINASTQKGGNI